MLRQAVACAALFASCVMPALADRCLGYPEERIIWCDDFDNYCVGGAIWPGYPPFPTRCPTDGTAVKDLVALHAQWPKDGTCGTGQGLSDNPNQQHNPPFSVTMPGYDPFPAARHTHSLVSAIQAVDPSRSAVNGWDEAPLTLVFFMEFGAGGAAPNSPFYVELAMEGDRAPTDYVLADCNALYGEVGLYPIVCQQWLNSQTVVPCPPLSTETHASLAFGTLAFTDRDPCDVETGRRPTQYHPCFFDGLKWWDLRSNLFPGVGDFSLPGSTGSSVCWFTMTIKTTTVDVTFESSDGLSTATIPRQYLGPFNVIASGTGQGCELDPNTGECVGSYGCFDHTGWANVHFDTPVLLGGDLSVDGACCKPDGTCEVVSEDVCVNTYGGTFAGINIACEEVLCCPMPFADADADGDVDQADFGAWQLCYTNTNGGVPVGCECFDQDDDDDIDGDDFVAFNTCWSGPGIAADPGCDD